MRYVWLMICLGTSGFVACGDDTTAPTLSDMDAGVESDADDANAGEGSCPGEQSESGICLPLSPVPAEACPGDISPDGVCLPEAPRGAGEGECPGERSAQGLCLPMAPQFEDWPCPEGWLSQPALVDEDGDAIEAPFTGQRPHSICRPPQLPEEVCPPGMIAQVGQGDCVPHGVACPPEGELWHDEDTIRQLAQGWEGRIWYAAPGGNTEGAGTRDDPLGGLRGALTRVSEGDILALSRSRFLDTFTVEVGVAIVGACVEGTIVESTSARDTGTVQPMADVPTLVTQMTLTGPRPAWHVHPGEALHTLSHVRIEQVRHVGILVEGSARIESVSVDGVGVFEGASVAACLRVSGGTVEVSGVHMTRCVGYGLWISGERTEVFVEDSVVADVQSLAPGADITQAGALVMEGARADLKRVLIDRPAESGVLALGSGSVAQVEDVWVVDAHGPDSGAAAAAVGGARLEGLRLGVEAQPGVSILTLDEGATVSLSDVWVSRTRPGTIREATAVGINPRTSMTLSRAVILQNHHGVLNAGTVNLEDIWIGARSPDLAPDGGHQVGIVQFGEATLSRVAVHGHTGSAFLGNPGEDGVTSTTLEDFWASDISAPLALARPDDLPFGLGVTVIGGELTLDRAHVEKIEGIGLQISHNAQATVRDVSISNIDRVGAEGQTFSGGLLVTRDSTMDGARLFISRVEGFGAGISERAEAVLDDLWISEVFSRGNDVPLGFVVDSMASARVTRAVFEDNTFGGVQVVEGGSLTLTDGLISGVGAHAPLISDLGKLNGAGIVITRSPVEFRRVQVQGSREYGVLIRGEGSIVDLEDIHITDTSPRGEKESTGLMLSTGCEVTGRRLSISDNNVAVWISSQTIVSEPFPTLVELSDVWLGRPRDLGGRAQVTHGVLMSGSELSAMLSRVQIQGRYGAAVAAWGEASVNLSDLSIVRQRELGLLTRSPSYGLLALSGAQVGAERFSLDDNAMLGIAVEGAQLTARDLIISRTSPADCTECYSSPGGVGVYASDGGVLNLSSFEITDNAQVGLLLLEESRIQASAGLLYDNRIGVNILSSEVDLDKDFEDVRTFSNDRDLATDTISTPTSDEPELRVPDNPLE